MRLLLAFIALLVCSSVAVAQADTTELLPIKVNGLWGYADVKGNVVIAPQFQSAESFNGNPFAKIKKEGRAGILNKQGEVTPLPIDANVKVFRGPYLLVEKDGKLGVTNNKLDELILPAEYSSIRYFNNTDFFRLRWDPSKIDTEFILTSHNDSLWGLHNFKGEEILPEKFTYIQLKGRYFYVTDSINKGLYSITGAELLPLQFEEITQLSQRFFAARQNGLWGLYDTSGLQQFAHAWQQINLLNQSWASFHYKDSVALINLETRIPLPDTLFDNYNAYGNTSIRLLKKGKRGLYNQKGEELLPVIFDDFYLSAGYYYTVSNKLVGLYDTDGNRIVDTKYDFIDDVENNVALVRINKSWGLINTTGQEIIKPRYTDIDLGSDAAKCRQGEKLDIYTLDANGRITEVVNYQNVVTLDINGSPNSRRNTQNLPGANNFNIRTRMGNWFYDTAQKKWGLLNQRGDTLIPPTYLSVTRTDSSLYAIVQVGSTDYTLNMAGFYTFFKGRKGLVRESDGKIIAKPSLAYIDPIVLRSKGFIYARALLLSGQFIVITPAGGTIISGCRFMDVQYQGITRAYIGEIDYKNTNTADSNHISAAAYINSLGGNVDGTRSTSPFAKELNFKKGYWVYIDTKGRRVNTKYSYASNFYKSRAIVVYEKKYGVISDKFQFIIQPQYSYISHLPYSDYTRFLVHIYAPKEGYIDTMGNPVTGFNYEHANNFSNGLGLVMSLRGDKRIREYRYVNENGHTINDTCYTRAYDFADGYALVRNSSLYTHINQNGEQVTGDYRRAGSFSNGRAWVTERGKYIVIDANGTKYDNNRFTKITPYCQNRATAIIDKAKWVVIDENANVVGTAKYKRSKNFDTLGNCIVAKKRKWGIINARNELLIPPKYKSIDGPVAGIYILRKGRKHFAVNLNSADKKIIKLGRANYVKVLPNGLIVMQNGNTMYTVKNGEKKILVKKAIPQKHLYDDFCIIGTGNKMGVMSYDGDTLMPPRYRKLQYCGNGLFFYIDDTKNQLGKLVTLKGEVLIKDIQAIHPFSNGVAPALKNGRWGIIDVNGVWVSEPKYNWVMPYQNNFARAGTNKTVFIADTDGHFILDANFDKIEYNPNAKLYRIELGKKVGYISPQEDWVWQPTQ